MRGLFQGRVRRQRQIVIGAEIKVLRTVPDNATLRTRVTWAQFAVESRLAPRQEQYNEELARLEELKPWLSAELYAEALEELRQKYIELQDPAYQFRAVMENLVDQLGDVAKGAAVDVFRDIGEALYEGTLSDFTSHVPRICSTDGATTASLTPQAESAYYLIVPRSVDQEGSYGTDSVGEERPQSESACFEQNF